MAYEEDQDEEENSFEDFEMSQDSEEERNRAFYGDDYTLLSQTEKNRNDAMSMTMQQRELADKIARTAQLRRDID